MSDLMSDISAFMDKVAAEQGHITSASTNVDSNLRLFYERLENLGYNLTELKPILECDDSMLILSGAGSGKTTALVLKLIRDIITGSLDKIITLPDGSTSRVRGRVLVSTFLKTGAEELSQAFNDWCKKLGITSIDRSCLVFKTIHAEVYDALKSMGVSVNMLEDSNALLKQVMQYLHIHSVMSHSNIVTADDVSNMACIVSYARNRLDSKKYDNSLMPEFALDTQTLDIILKTFKQHRQATGKMDFEDMQEVLLDGLQKYKNVQDFIANRYDYVYVDEFQDTSQLQYELLKYYFNSAKRVICIGDDDQCVPEGTKILTPDGYANVEDLKEGSEIVTATGHCNVGVFKISHVHRNSVNKRMVKVTTEYGHVVTATPEHTAFVKLVPNDIPASNGNRVTLTHTLFGSSQEFKTLGVNKSELSATSNNMDYVAVLQKHLNVTQKCITNSDIHTFNARSTTGDIQLQMQKCKEIVSDCAIQGIDLKLQEQAKLTNTVYTNMPFANIKEGMLIPVVHDGSVIDDKVMSVEYIDYSGFVYDLGVDETLNFVANDVVVHNCIYSWRGSDVDIIKNRFETDYNPVVKTLTVNYRCAENILKPVIPSIELNQLRHEKDLKAARKGGKVRVIKDNNVNLLTKYVKEDLDAGRSIGILGRTNNDLLVPAIILEIESGGNTALFNLSKGVSLENRVPKQIFGLIDLLTKRYTDGFEDLLKMFLPRRSWYEASTLASTLAINKSDSLFTLNSRDLAYSCPILYNSVLKGVIQMQKEDPVLAYILMLNYMRDYVYTGTTVFAKKAKDLLKNVITLITEHEKISKMDIFELDELFNEILPERFDKRKSTKTKAYIKLTTVHEAKGKEWDSVYIWNDYYGCFPNVVGNREMTQDEFEEERRVHYIAWTRAKSLLTVFTSSDSIDSDKGFLHECDLSLSDGAEITENENVINKGKILLHRGKTVTPSATPEERAEIVFNGYVLEKAEDNRLTNKHVADVVIALEDSTLQQLWNRFKTTMSYEAFVAAVDVDNLPDVISGILHEFFSTVASEKMNGN